MEPASKSDRPNPANIQVVGLGLARTGVGAIPMRLIEMAIGLGADGKCTFQTMSLATALGKLGFGPCYHLLGQDSPCVLKLSRQPGTDSKDGNEAHSCKAGEARLWDEVFHPTETTNVSRCLDEIFTKYDKREWKSVCDVPTTWCPEAMYAAYPDAKFILTLRDKEAWFASWVKNIVGAFEKYSWTRYLSYDNWVSHPILQNICVDMHFSLDPAGTAMKKYDEHTERVKRVIPGDQLLIYNLGDGWGPLCKFLEVPMPNGPYPRTNDAQAFRDNIMEGYVYPTLPMLGSLATVVMTGGIAYLVYNLL